MSNIGAITIKFAECRSLRYVENGFSIHMGKIEGYGETRKVTEDKKWKMVIDSGKNIYIFMSYSDAGHEMQVKTLMELETIEENGKNKYKKYKLDRSDDEREKKQGLLETVSEIPLKYGDSYGVYDYYFILTKQWLTSDRLKQIESEIKLGRCNRVTKIDFQGSFAYNKNYFTDRDSFDKKNSIVTLVDIIDTAYHLHANFFSKRNELIQHIALQSQNEKRYEDRSIERLIYTTLVNAEELSKKDSKKRNKFEEYKRCLKGKNGLSGSNYYTYLRGEFCKEEQLHSAMTDYADKLCSVLGSVEFRGAFNDYMYKGCPDELQKKGTDLYAELILQLESTLPGARYLNEEYRRIDDNYGNYDEECKERKNKQGKQDERSPVVKIFDFSKKPADGIYSIIAEYKVETIEKAIASSKGGIYYRNKRLNFISEATRVMKKNPQGGKYIAKEYEDIIKMVKNNSIYKTQQKYLKGIEQLKERVNKNEAALKKYALSGNAILGARLVVHGTCLAATLGSFKELAIANPKDGWEYVSGVCDIAEPVAKIMELTAPTKLGAKFFTKAGLAIGVVGGCIDAVINFSQSISDLSKGNIANGVLNGCMVICNMAMVAGAILINTPFAFAGAVLIGIGMTVWLICMLLDDFVFKRYDEMKVWLSHSRYGRCYQCGKGCPSPKLNSEDCHSDASAYEWTKYVVGRKEGTSMVEREILPFLPNQYVLATVSKPVYSRNYWFKTMKEHAESYRNLLMEGLQ